MPAAAFAPSAPTDGGEVLLYDVTRQQHAHQLARAETHKAKLPELFTLTREFIVRSRAQMDRFRAGEGQYRRVPFRSGWDDTPREKRKRGKESVCQKQRAKRAARLLPQVTA